MFHVPENYRYSPPGFEIDARDGNNGAFVLPPVIGNRGLYVLASDGMDWEHVSVHAYEGKVTRIPTWVEMCKVKEIFWDEEDVVMQLHPRKSEYVNNHGSVLHLWRPTAAAIPEPPSIMVGVKGVEIAQPVRQRDTPP
jgi:hypothetical protein